MKMNSFFEIFLKPLAIFLMSTAVIQNHMNLFIFRKVVDDTPEERLKVFPIFLGCRFCVDIPCGYI